MRASLGFTSFCVALCLFFGSIITAVNYINFPGDANRAIKSNQTYNNIWWSGWTIPNGWDNVALIAVPVR